MIQSFLFACFLGISPLTFLEHVTTWFTQNSAKWIPRNQRRLIQIFLAWANSIAYTASKLHSIYTLNFASKLHILPDFLYISPIGLVAATWAHSWPFPALGFVTVAFVLQFLLVYTFLDQFRSSQMSVLNTRELAARIARQVSLRNRKSALIYE